MYQSARQLIGSKVFDPQGRLICKIKRAVLDPNNGQILGFVTSMPRPQNILSLIDVEDWKKEYLLLAHHYEFHFPEDIVRINNALREKSELFGKKVRTESNQHLGFVTNYSLDLKNHILASITVQRRFLRFFYHGGSIIHQKNILEITPHFVVVRDNTVKIPIAETLPDKSIERSPAI